MKRAAETQLTKDNENDEEVPQEEGTGFQKADPAVLGTRKIRGLPRRSLGTANGSTPSTPGATVDVPKDTTMQLSQSTSRFGAFSGFGGTGASHAFTFAVPPSQPTQSPSQPISAPATPFSTPLHSALPANKPFLSFANTSNLTPPNTPPLSSDPQKKQDAALKYYMSLRGINVSFLDAATKAMQADPFVDIVELLEEYKSFRLTIQKEFDDPSKAPETSKSANTSGPIINSQESPSKPSMEPASTVGGFIPKPSAFSGSGSSSFPWFKPSVPSATSDKPSSDAFSPFIGKASSGLTQSGIENSSLSSAGQPTTSFADSKAAAALPETPGNDPSPSKADNTSPFTFGSTAKKSLTPGFSSFLSPSKPSATGETSAAASPIKFGAQTTSPPSPSAFGFGSGKNFGTSSPFGSLGKGSIGNPVGFGFGSPSSTTTQSAAKALVESTSGNAAPTKAGTENVATEGSMLNAPAPDAEHDPSPAPSQGSVYDADGPGEEEESTLFETRAKAYKMQLSGEKKGMVAAGSGQLKLKSHNELPKRRILMRNSSNGQIILNFSLFPGLKATVDQKILSFCVPGENESTTAYRLRVPTEADALKWQEIIHSEVDHITSSSDA